MTNGYRSRVLLGFALAAAAAIGAPAQSDPAATEPEAGASPTYYRGSLQSPGGELPFLVREQNERLGLVHGLEDRSFEGAIGGDSDWRFPPYDARITTPFLPPGGESWQGAWRKVRGNGEDTLPFRMRGVEGEVAPMFPLAGKPLAVAGRWRVRFASDPEHDAVAIFGKNPSPLFDAAGEVAGTFLTVTGDYRYLVGTARGDQLRLAVFDGAHAFLFHATMLDDGTLRGEFWSGSTWHDTWTARRDDAVALPDAFTLTRAEPAVDIGALRYPDVATGEPRQLRDLFGRATLVVLFGTWCPNCGDSGAYLRELRTKYEDRGLRVIGLAFEHGDDRKRHARVVQAYRERYDVPWPILLAGPSSKRAASAAFPAVDAVRSYPTTLFLDDSGTVRAVHQGFAGPATGAAYAAQKAAFEAIVRRLLGVERGEPQRRK